MILSRSSDNWNNDDRKKEYKSELKKMQYIERNAAHMVTAVTGVLFILAAITAMKNTAIFPRKVIMFESCALIFAVVGVLPKYWIPQAKVTLFRFLRHLKTVLYTFSISLFLGGLLLLLKLM